MTSQNHPRTEHTGILDTTVELGAAVTKFAVDQLETAICAVSSPGKAFDRMKRSMDNLVNGMNASVEAKGEAKDKEAKTAIAPVECKREEVAAEPAEEPSEAIQDQAFNGRKT